MKRYWPSASVTAVRVPISDGLVTVIVTPGMTACELSVTRPLMAPVPDVTAWPNDDDANATIKQERETEQCDDSWQPPRGLQIADCRLQIADFKCGHLAHMSKRCQRTILSGPCRLIPNP